MCLCVIWCSLYCDRLPTMKYLVPWHWQERCTAVRGAQSTAGGADGASTVLQFSSCSKMCLATSTVCTAEKFSCREQWNSDRCITLKHQHRAANLHTAATITIPVKPPAPKGAILGQCYLLYWQLTWHFMRMDVKSSERKQLLEKK